ncbi:hypothetical protein QBC35DRAFT_463607 [Podospora australis]|uniref:Uncharacterized protein n=1 Tax=Podospora australis TaxID=1536484 RepID=A0AAN6WUB0_9PEZI|nr:hypothetical protein QBC35DRAFT_463607 [Podospora australis]
MEQQQLNHVESQPSSSSSSSSSSNLSKEHGFPIHVRNVGLFMLGIVLVELWFGKRFQDLPTTITGPGTCRGGGERSESRATVFGSFKTASDWEVLVEKVCRDAGGWYGAANTTIQVTTGLTVPDPAVPDTATRYAEPWDVPADTSPVTQPLSPSFEADEPSSMSPYQQLNSENQAQMYDHEKTPNRKKRSNRNRNAEYYQQTEDKFHGDRVFADSKPHHPHHTGL